MEGNSSQTEPKPSERFSFTSGVEIRFYLNRNIRIVVSLKCLIIAFTTLSIVLSWRELIEIFMFSGLITLITDFSIGRYSHYGMHDIYVPRRCYFIYKNSLARNLRDAVASSFFYGIRRVLRLAAD